MAILSGSMGEPTEEEDACDLCWHHIKAAVSGACWHCILDGTEQGVQECWQDAHSSKAIVDMAAVAF